MNDFPEPETLGTLALARETYGKLLAAFHEKDGQTSQLEADLDAANELVDESATAFAQAQTDLKAKAAEADQAKRDLATAKQTIQSLETQVGSLETTVNELKASAKSAEEEAAEICASVGVDPLQIKPDDTPEQPDLMAQYRAIEDPGQRTAFFRKHKDQLLSRR